MAGGTQQKETLHMDYKNVQPLADFDWNAIDEKAAPPMFQISKTHSAATWLLHPDAPKIGKPAELEARLERARKEVEKYL